MVAPRGSGFRRLTDKPRMVVGSWIKSKDILTIRLRLYEAGIVLPPGRC
jgi:hypothetical protein